MNNAGPRISIITVVLNGEKHLEQAIRSVLDQSYSNVEYLVIDGGSTDGTLEIIKKYESRIASWTSGPDRGIYDAMNKGIAMATGELIGLLNADDYYAPEVFDVVAKRYDRSRPAIYYGHTWVIDDELKRTYAFYSSLRPWRGMSVGHQSMFVDRRIYASAENYRVRYRFAADYDFFLRTLSWGVPYVALDAFVVFYRDGGMTRRNLYRALNEGRAVNKACYGAFSKVHALYVLLFMKSILLNELQKLLPALIGKKLASAFKLFYLRKIIASKAGTD